VDFVVGGARVTRQVGLHTPKSRSLHSFPTPCASISTLLAAGTVAAGLQWQCPVRAMVVMELHSVITILCWRLGAGILAEAQFSWCSIQVLNAAHTRVQQACCNLKPRQCSGTAWA
jgi:hypothetical protein